MAALDRKQPPTPPTAAPLARQVQRRLPGPRSWIHGLRRTLSPSWLVGALLRPPWSLRALEQWSPPLGACDNPAGTQVPAFPQLPGDTNVQQEWKTTAQRAAQAACSRARNGEPETVQTLVPGPPQDSTCSLGPDVRICESSPEQKLGPNQPRRERPLLCTPSPRCQQGPSPDSSLSTCKATLADHG